jgi:hypothetical protein
LPYQLFVGLRMLALAEFGKIFGGDGPGKTELRRPSCTEYEVLRL